MTKVAPEKPLPVLDGILSAQHRELSIEDARATLTRMPAETLPGALLTVLQRGYLDQFDQNNWTVAPADAAPHRPVLREITRLGRHRPESGSDRGLQALLVSCASPGHALVTVLHGREERQQIFLGVRRLQGASVATVDYLDRVVGAFRSSYPGLDFAEDTADLDAQDLDELACLSVITGVPSLMAGSEILPNLDSVMRATRGARFQVSIVAEPLDHGALVRAIDQLRQIRSDIHALVRQTETSNRSETQGSGSSRAETGDASGSTKYRTGALLGLSALLQFAAAIEKVPTIGQVAGPIQALAYLSGVMGNKQTVSEQTSSSVTTQSGSSHVRLDAVAEACEQIVLQHLERLQRAAAAGLWRVAIYLAAINEHDLHRVQGAMRGLMTGRASHLDPIRATAPRSDVVRDAMRYGRMISLQPKTKGPLAPEIATSFDQLATCLSSSEAVHLFALPESELPGLPVRERTTFSLTPPIMDQRSIILGRVQDQEKRSLAPLPIRADTLNRNAMVVGLVGSGKTTTCQRLLVSAYLELGVPFLVIEPVKTEYRELASLAALGGRLSVFSAGRDSGSPLRLNPLEPVPGFPVARHLDLLKAVFNAAFPMFAGMSYVLEEALVDVYTERGWSLRDETATTPYRNSFERAALLPDLRALHERVDVVLNRKGYGQEIQANLGAALRSRLNSLLVGQKGLIFDVRSSTPASMLFDAPAVIELHRLGDDEEKAFAIALVFVLLCEHAEMRQADAPTSRRGSLQHLTLIEEAHRLLAAPRNSGGSESADARGKAVNMFTDLLAELRAYGEGFIVADQIPTKIASEVLKNTALKITHRLTSPDDRQAMGGATNLSPEQIRAINLLQPGEAIVHDADIGDALCVKIDRLATPGPASRARSVEAERREWLRYGGGCEPCAEPCRWRSGLEDDGFGSGIAAMLEGWLKALLECRDLSALPVPTDAPDGRLFCGALFALRRQVEDVLRVRNEAMGGRSLRPSDRVATERALSAIAPVLRSWLNNETAAPDAGSGISHILEAQPPRPRPGCKICPDPCLGLTEVAILMPAFANFRSLVEGPQPGALRAQAFDAAFTKLAPNVRRPRVSRHCAVVLLGGERPGLPVQELLEALTVAEADAPDPANKAK